MNKVMEGESLEERSRQAIAVEDEDMDDDVLVLLEAWQVTKNKNGVV